MGELDHLDGDDLEEESERFQKWCKRVDILNNPVLHNVNRFKSATSAPALLNALKNQVLASSP